ncbi:hypothetical protein [Burkholderia orbicola]|uniref:hypothetical protein n=1 Tax=Burkholderia orbicola TaxID=2978683 RepID=UPI002659627C|nr:hypothetical protein [Burkholderia orbicola]
MHAASIEGVHGDALFLMDAARVSGRRREPLTDPRAAPQSIYVDGNIMKDRRTVH